MYTVVVVTVVRGLFGLGGLVSVACGQRILGAGTFKYLKSFVIQSLLLYKIDQA